MRELTLAQGDHKIARKRRKEFSHLGIQEHPTRKRIGKDNGGQGEGERLERKKDRGEDQNSFSFFSFLNSSWMNE